MILRLIIVFIIYILVNTSILADPILLSDWHQPYSENEVLFDNYTSVLNCAKKTPYYVFYDLYPSDFLQGDSKRKNKWPDYVPQNIKNICGSDYAVSKDYSNSGYDRGHLAPASDFKSIQRKENATFSFANAAPQNKISNRTFWADLEKYERKLAIQHNGITVITGVIQSNNKYIGNNVGVPDYFYKIILWKDNGEIKYTAFLAQNIESVPEKIHIEELKKLSGLDFYLKNTP